MKASSEKLYKAINEEKRRLAALAAGKFVNEFYRSLQMVDNRDYVIAVDRSGSMSDRDCDGKSRWEYCRESVRAICNHVDNLDPDGIDLYFYNTSFQKFENITAEKLDETWSKLSPIGGTCFAPVLKEIFEGHFAKQERPTTILFITDGEAADRAETSKLIIDASKKIEADAELAISFIQVGKDANAKRFLQQLDDELPGQGAKFDIVDTITMDDVEKSSLDEVLMKAITD